MEIARSKVVTPYTTRALATLHSHVLNIPDVKVTPYLATSEICTILCFYNASPKNEKLLKQAMNDPHQELQLYYEAWSIDEEKWVVSRFSPEPKTHFENKVFNAILKAIPSALQELVSEELYEEAALLKQLETQFTL